MPKKFVVRLRKGGVTGNIVANSQVITINPLTAGNIFPSNFQDGRLAGRITTTNRAANFIKAIIPRPTTTTTTTTRAPSQTTTTTTLPAGSIPPPTTPTTPTTRAPSTGKWEIVSISPRRIIAGQFYTVTISYPTLTTDATVFLGIIQVTNSSVIADNKFRPAIEDINAPPQFYQSPNAINQILSTHTVKAGPAGTFTVKITLQRSLTWLLSDFTGFNFFLYDNIYKQLDVWGKGDVNLLPIIGKGAASNITIDVDDIYAYRYSQRKIVVTGLSEGTSYALVLKHWWEWADGYGRSPVAETRKFESTWFLGFNNAGLNNTEGWILGGTYSGGRFPREQPVTPGSSQLVNAYYYYFTATSAPSKAIPLEVTSDLINVNYLNTIGTNNFTDKQFDAAKQYKFTVSLATGDGRQHIDANVIKDEIILRDHRPQIRVRIDNVRTLTKTNKLSINIATSRAINSTDLSSRGIRILIAFFGENNNVTSNSFIVSTAKPHQSQYVGNQNTYFDILTPINAGAGGDVEVQLNPAGTYKNGQFGFEMFYYNVGSEPITPVNWPSTYEKIASYRGVYTIDSASTENITVTNLVYTPSDGILNETNNNTLLLSFDITSDVVKTVYWRIEGQNITADDFDGASSGNFDTKVGTAPITKFPVTARADAAIEGSEVFTIKLYTSNSAGAVPFYTFPQFTIEDTSTRVDELVTLASSEVPPFFNNVPLTFVVSRAWPNSKFDVIANGNIIKKDLTVDKLGSWTGTIDFSGTPVGELPITFKFAHTGNERISKVKFVGDKTGGAVTPPPGGAVTPPPPPPDNPFADNLEFGRLYLGKGQEGEDLYGQAYKFTKSTAGITKIVIQAKLASYTGDVSYNEMSYYPYTVYDSDTPETEDSGRFAIPGVGEIRLFTGSHPEETNFGFPACKVGYRMTITYSGGTWSTSSTSKPADYIRTGGTSSGGDG